MYSLIDPLMAYRYQEEHGAIYHIIRSRASKHSTSYLIITYEFNHISDRAFHLYRTMNNIHIIQRRDNVDTELLDTQHQPRLLVIGPKETRLFFHRNHMDLSCI